MKSNLTHKEVYNATYDVTYDAVYEVTNKAVITEILGLAWTRTRSAVYYETWYLLRHPTYDEN